MQEAVKNATDSASDSSAPTVDSPEPAAPAKDDMDEEWKWLDKATESGNLEKEWNNQ